MIAELLFVQFDIRIALLSKTPVFIEVAIPLFLLYLSQRKVLLPAEDPWGLYME